MKTFYINLKSAVERREAIETAFKNEDLHRIEAIDGMRWSTGELQHGLPVWRSGDRDRLVTEGLLDAESHLPPTHVACNLGHKAALEKFLETGGAWCVVLEDDVEPTEELRDSSIQQKLKIPDGCDLFYLMDERALRGQLKVNPDGQVARVLTMAAYVISRTGAEVYLRSLTPMVYLADFQIPVCCFASMKKWVPRFGLEARESGEKIKAYASKRGGLIRHSPMARQSSLGH